MAEKLSLEHEQRDRKSSALSAKTPIRNLWRGHRHLLDTDALEVDEIECFLELARRCKEFHDSARAPHSILSNKIVANLFYENSTRTRSSFDIAATRLGASVLNLDIQTSSVVKGESIEDTALTLVAMGVNAVVQRHSSSGAAHTLAKAMHDRVCVLNAGDGWNAHPTQALLDVFTMLEIVPTVKGIKVAIIGDIAHSRVARSNFWLLQKMGAEVHVCGPPSLVPKHLESLGVHVHPTLDPALKDADFVMALRLQLERQQQGLIPSIGEYKQLFGLNHERLRIAKPNVRVMHPGPVNRGIEVTDDLIDDPTMSLLTRQVANGIPVRMAALLLLLSTEETIAPL